MSTDLSNSAQAPPARRPSGLFRAARPRTRSRTFQRQSQEPEDIPRSGDSGAKGRKIAETSAPSSPPVKEPCCTRDPRREFWGPGCGGEVRSAGPPRRNRTRRQKRGGRAARPAHACTMVPDVRLRRRGHGTERRQQYPACALCHTNHSFGRSTQPEHQRVPGGMAAPRALKPDPPGLGPEEPRAGT